MLTAVTAEAAAPRCLSLGKAGMATLNSIGYGWAGSVYEAVEVEEPEDWAAGETFDPWSAAVPTRRFVDIRTGDPAPFGTVARVAWSAEALYVSYEAEEPFVSAASRRDGDLLFFENDLELFIDGRDSFYELEFNAFGTRYEVFYVWRDAAVQGSKWDVPRFDLRAETTQTFAGDHDHDADSFWYGNHPRGTRWAFLDYRLPDLELDVAVQGKINDASQVDEGWSARLRIPWSGLVDLADGRSLPPRPGDSWRMFFGRFEQLATREPGQNVGLGWAANPHGVNDTHIPESWTVVRFAGKD